MASKKSIKGPLGKNGQAWSERQKKLIKNIPTSKSHAEAAVKAGYPIKNAAQSAPGTSTDARKSARSDGSARNLGGELIDNHLRRLLTAQRTIFAQKDGKFRDKRTVDALETQIRALDMALLLHGSYAPRDPKEAAQFGVKAIVQDIRGVPRPPIDIWPGMAIPEPPTDTTNDAKPTVRENGEQPTGKGGHD